MRYLKYSNDLLIRQLAKNNHPHYIIPTLRHRLAETTLQRHATLERFWMNSHAGAWELYLMGGVFFQVALFVFLSVFISQIRVICVLFFLSADLLLSCAVVVYFMRVT